MAPDMHTTDCSSLDLEVHLHVTTLASNEGCAYPIPTSVNCRQLVTVCTRQVQLAYHKHLLNVEVGLIKSGDSLVEILGQLVGIFNGHAPALPQVGLHGMGTVPQQDNIALGPLEHRWSVIDVATQHIIFWSRPTHSKCTLHN